MTSITRPKPAITQDTAFFWEAARERRLAIQRCTSCGVLRHPPTPVCAACGSFAWDTVDSGGKGSLLTYTIIHVPAVPPFKYPLAVGVVQLDEGTRVVTEIVDTPHDAIKIGMPLSLGFLVCDDGLTLPVFRAAEATAKGSA